jgi:hypothetical protein
MDDFHFVPGWENRPEDVAEIAGLQPFGSFEDSPAGQQTDPLPDLISLHDAAVKVIGHFLPVRSQGSAGTCVSFGTVRAVELTMLVAIARNGAFSFPANGIATEPVYGGSRIEIGKGRLGRGDGSIGAWAAEFVKRWGIAPRQAFPAFGFDLSEYSIDISRNWGRNGVPDGFEPTLKQHPVGGIAKITSIEGALRALASGHGIAESSNRLLNRNRNSDGTIGTYRGGGHCMAIVGAKKKNGVWWFQDDNSWGNYHGGGLDPAFPCPAGGMIHQDDFANIIDQGDTWAFSDVVGFPQRDYLDWGAIG